MIRSIWTVKLQAGLWLATAGVSLSHTCTARAEEIPTTVTTPVVARHPGGLNLLLTQAELRDWVQSYEMKTGQNLTSPIEEEEVLVKAPGMLAPMRDVSQDAWGGIAAPFWAILNPTNAWRILVPIPPKGTPQDERPAPDPR
ncbi:MAG TPA: hypothetical protein VJN00_06815 [Steroidobacteraceae bacterium]|jgi:hypothetical protein|nr:hypothetical protein [Steroidobacteraceae bacterium]